MLHVEPGMPFRGGISEPAMSATLEALLQDVLAAWNAHDADLLAGFYAPEYEGVDVADAALQAGRTGIRQAALRYFTAFPDLSVRADEMVVEGTCIAVVWTARGTHRGVLMNIPASGRIVEVRGVSVLAVRNQQIVRAFTMWDVAGFLRALGLLPELAAAG